MIWCAPRSNTSWAFTPAHRSDGVFSGNDGAIGYLVGETAQGLAYMFTMIDHARLNVGMEGVAISSALSSRRWPTPGSRAGQADGRQQQPDRPIRYHPDVRRMLMDMKSRIEAMRALAYQTAAHMDYAHHHPDEAVRREHQARVELLTPVVKGWCTETSINVTSTGIQVHGGMGFIEETGAAQHFRDARITTIYRRHHGHSGQRPDRPQSGAQAAARWRCCWPTSTPPANNCWPAAA